MRARIAKPDEPVDEPAPDAMIRPFDHSLPMQLLRARELVMQRFRPHLQEHGLTEQQWRVVRALAETEALEINELSERCCILPASLSRILPKLAEGKLVSRTSNHHDQRRVIVSLTARGRELFRKIAPQSEKIYAEIAAEAGAERVERLYSALEDLIARLK
jgi:homoprotocatechuate degradation regulator HpaR